MHEQNNHINPWAEKLLDVTVPPLPESWKEMESLLDRELPIESRKSYKGWFLLILLLLLLIGVCNYRRSWVSNKAAITHGSLPGQLNHIGKNKTAIVSANKRNKAANKHFNGLDTINRSVIGIGMLNSKAGKQEKMQAAKPLKVLDMYFSRNKDYILNERQKTPLQNERETLVATHKTIASNDRMPPSINSISSRSVIAHINRESVNHNYSISKGNSEKNIPDINLTDSSRMGGQDVPTNGSNKFPLLVNRITRKGEIQNELKKKDSIQPEPIMVTGSLKEQDNKDIIKQKTADSAADYKGIVLAIGLNQFFPIGNEKKADFNSNGISGNLLDYIPVPSLRYYFNRKLFAQAELQFNTPQYTQTLLADQQQDISSVPGQVILNSVFIKKLYYFNIPLTIGYSPVKHFYLGTGLQFSRLTNAVGLMQDSKMNSSVPTNEVLPSNDSSLISTKIKNIKSDVVYQKLRTNEWRFLLDANYQWKTLTFGFRYNQAFTDFIHLKVSNTYLTEARNSSLQVYLKYILWDHRGHIKKFWHKQK